VTAPALEGDWSTVWRLRGVMSLFVCIPCFLTNLSPMKVAPDPQLRRAYAAMVAQVRESREIGILNSRDDSTALVTSTGVGRDDVASSFLIKNPLLDGYSRHPS
jgi:hypothetical protein